MVVGMFYYYSSLWYLRLSRPIKPGPRTALWVVLNIIFFGLCESFLCEISSAIAECYRLVHVAAGCAPLSNAPWRNGWEDH